MDNIDRMYRHLVRTIRSRFPQYLVQPFEVAELHQTILPYRHHRRELGLETNEDYEVTLTELLSGARDYLIVDERMRDVLRTELASANPDPAAFKQFATSTVALSPAALRSLEAGPSDALSPPRTAAAGSASTAGTAPTAVIPRTDIPHNPSAPSAVSRKPATSAHATAPAKMVPSGSTPTVVRPSGASSIPGTGSVVPREGDRCRSCDEPLPPDRAITFCPHCGQNVTTVNCPACGSELEVGWNFCPTCGRPAAAK